MKFHIIVLFNKKCVFLRLLFLLWLLVVLPKAAGLDIGGLQLEACLWELAGCASSVGSGLVASPGEIHRKRGKNRKTIHKINEAPNYIYIVGIGLQKVKPSSKSAMLHVLQSDKSHDSVQCFVRFSVLSLSPPLYDFVVHQCNDMRSPWGVLQDTHHPICGGACLAD